MISGNLRTADCQDRRAFQERLVRVQRSDPRVELVIPTRVWSIRLFLVMSMMADVCSEVEKDETGQEKSFISAIE